jgi:hypothetical protein
MGTTPKQIGRPMKPPTPGKRTTISAMVSPEMKQYVDATARANGRSQAQQIEHLLQLGRDATELLEFVRTPVPELKRRLAEANFRERGYAVIHHSHGDIWVPPGHPAAPKPSGFIPLEEDAP